MTIEQKSRAYDEALRRAKDMLETDLHESGVWAITKIFPELKESEDKRIRKWLYDYISNCPNNNFEFYGGVGKDAVLNYLEKQKEQKSVECIKFDNEFENQISHLIASVLNGEHEYNEGFVKYVAQSLLGYAKEEQKPVKWSEDFEENIRNLLHDKLTGHSEDGTMTRTTFIDDKTLRDIVNGIWFYVGKEALKYPNKELNVAECSEEDERIRKFILEVIKTYDGMSNSTKEKCISYLEKQKEQKPLEYLPKEKINAILGKLTDLSYSKLIPFKSRESQKIDEISTDILDLLDYPIKQKPEWSEEDKHRCDDAIYFLETAKKHYADTSEIELTIKWLKSLQPQPKQEWSEEDEEMFDEALAGVLLARNRMNDTGCIGLAERFEKAYKWLESFHPRPHWKPSEEQMKALSETIAFAPDTFKPKYTPMTLQDDLKNMIRMMTTDFPWLLH